MNSWPTTIIHISPKAPHTFVLNEASELEVYGLYSEHKSLMPRGTYEVRETDKFGRWEIRVERL